MLLQFRALTGFLQQMLMVSINQVPAVKKECLTYTDTLPVKNVTITCLGVCCDEVQVLTSVCHLGGLLPPSLTSQAQPTPAQLDY